MRLTPTEQDVIRDARLHYLGVRPRRFGFRLIDVVLNAGGAPLPIYEVAQRERILL